MSRVDADSLVQWLVGTWVAVGMVCVPVTLRSQSNPRQADSNESSSDSSPATRITKSTEVKDVTSAYRLHFVQDGELHPVENHRVVLEPRSFRIYAVMDPEISIMLNVSRDATNRNRVVEGKSLIGRVGHPATGLAEGLQNGERELLLDKNGSNYWFYKGSEKHRFDKVPHVGEFVVGEHSVEAFSDDGERIPISEFAGDSLYVVELAPTSDPMEPHPPKRAYTIEFSSGEVSPEDSEPAPDSKPQPDSQKSRSDSK